MLRVCAVTDWLDPSKAKVDFEKAIELGADEYCLYGILHSKMGEHEKAIKAFTAALEKQPNDTDLLLLRGNEKSDHKEYSGASADYEAVLKIDPKSSDSLNALAWLKATCPEDKFRDGKKADELAREACELTGWKRPVFFGALAAGYAETGDFSEAVEWQEKAINEATVSKEEVEDMRLALNNYKSNKPHRDK